MLKAKKIDPITQLEQIFDDVDDEGNDLTLE